MADSIEQKIEFLKEQFLKAEAEYLQELLKIPENKEFIRANRRRDPKELAVDAIRKINAIETGQVAESDLERVETDIVLLLASIKFPELERGPKERKKYINDEYER